MEGMVGREGGEGREGQREGRREGGFIQLVPHSLLFPSTYFYPCCESERLQLDPHHQARDEGGFWPSVGPRGHSPPPRASGRELRLGPVNLSSAYQTHGDLCGGKVKHISRSRVQSPFSLEGKTFDNAHSTTPNFSSS